MSTLCYFNKITNVTNQFDIDFNQNAFLHNLTHCLKYYVIMDNYDRKLSKKSQFMEENIKCVSRQGWQHKSTQCCKTKTSRFDT